MDDSAMTTALLRGAGLPVLVLPSWNPWRKARFGEEITAAAGRLARTYAHKEAQRIGAPVLHP